ncbi:hypothetical protein [Nostoc sp. FACHB-110]|uniref:hypothetical protein n=1 Tax=Nostoc sp. FACHB-110 TaxID=2692834 RepID=UPI0016891798|nr:hypothetical protein [Nostoc sp. FACHB-110]MBD2435825.1 hypothetical protein [Nostoc sp. FACHB-110]
MSNFENRQKQAQEKQAQQDFLKSLINDFTNNQSKTTRTVDRLIGEVSTSTGKISVYRTDHYLGTNNTPDKGAFQYSRWTAIIGGIRISAVDYQSLMQILNVIK